MEERRGPEGSEPGYDPSSGEGASEGGGSPDVSEEKREFAEQFQKKPFPTRGTAPSSPDMSKLTLIEPSQAAKDHVPSEVDAMGQDKRRAIVGHAYGPSRRSQLMFFGIVIAVVVVIVGGGSLLVSTFDKGPKVNADKAPWSQSSAPQSPAVRPE